MLVALLAEQKFFRTFGVDQQIFEHDVRMSSQMSSVPYVRSAVAGVVCQICYRMGGKSDQLSQVFTSDHLSRGVISINSLLMVCQFSC